MVDNACTQIAVASGGVNVRRRILEARRHDVVGVTSEPGGRGAFYNLINGCLVYLTDSTGVGYAG